MEVRLGRWRGVSCKGRRPTNCAEKRPLLPGRLRAGLYRQSQPACNALYRAFERDANHAASVRQRAQSGAGPAAPPALQRILTEKVLHPRSEEHTSELQSPDHLVCRLLLEKKKASNSQVGVRGSTI